MIPFDESHANTLIDTAERMIRIWEQLSPEKKQALVDRFGTKEKALAALVTTQMVAPAQP